MKTTQLIAAAVLSLAATTSFAQQGDVKAPANTPTRALKYHQVSNDTSTVVQGKTRAQVKAQLLDKDASEFSNRNTQR